MKQEEIWKDVPGYEGLYEVSNYGRVKALPRFKRGKGDSICYTKEHILRPLKLVHGYVGAALYDNNGKDKRISIHRLVATTFIPNPNNFSQVNHLNEIKDDNRVENLEWSTASHNINWGTRNDRVAEKMERPIVAIRLSDGKTFYFKSIAEAKRQGHTPNRISKKIHRYQGVCINEEYVWKYADDMEFVMPEIIDKRKKLIAISVVDGSEITFCSIRDAERNGFSRNSIKRAANSKTNPLYKNYYWKITNN